MGESRLGVSDGVKWKWAVHCIGGPAQCELECKLPGGEAEGLVETPLHARAGGRDAGERRTMS